MTSEKTRAPQNADKYIVRLPEGMRDQIAQAAKKSGRSMNSEIVARLTYTFEKDLEDWAGGGAVDSTGGEKYDKIANLIIQHLDKHLVEKHLVFQRMPVTSADEPAAEPPAPAAKRARKSHTLPKSKSQTK